MPTEEPPDEDAAWSWTRCPACGIQEQRRHGNTKIQDLVTKGEEPFANIVRSMFGIQPADDRKADLPNKGKKVLCFSDGRQKAARLARDLQSNVELDSFREVMAAIVDRYDGELSMDQFFAEFAVYCDKHNIVFFDDSDEYTSNQGVEYRGSRTHFEQIQGSLDDIANRYSLDSVDEIPDHPMARKELADRPRQFDQTLLRSIGDEYYSIAASLVGYLRPTDAVLDAITQANPSLDTELVESILVEALKSACEDRFFDSGISSIQRSKSLAYGWMSEEEVGVEYDELIPDYIKETLEDTVSESEWQTLVMSLVDTNPTLFEPVSPGKFVVNPAATTIELRVTEDWYRCEGCRQFAAVSLDGVCPREDCSGHLETVGDEDIHLQARKNFLRNPPQRVVNENRDPFTLRSEEHSAQLSAKDFSEPFSRSEIYELLFQDILVGDTDVEQPIDVLSCTTTMEVGIDIGSLTGVAMRTVPPAPENYEQRAGRAGRRGVGLSTIITFADNSPHESHYFDNPELMVGGEGTEPIIYSGNEKIAQRHINASLLARFFDPSEFAETSDVFRSLGTASEFFGNNGAHSFGAFEGWVKEEILVPDSDIVEELGTLLPDALGEEQSGDWRTEFVQTAAAEFIENLRELQERTTWTDTDEEDSDLLSTLLDDALLPTFSFPTDVCDFIVRGADADSGHPKTKYEMSRDLKQALSTYAPGREIVVDKKTYESYGVYFRFTDDPNDRATTVDWDDLDWLNFCRRCETILDERDENLAEQEMLCPVCEEEEISAVQMFTPPAFAPEVDQAGQPEQASGYSEERVYATPPKYPLTPTPADASDQEMLDEKTIGPSRVGRLNDEQLLVANFGPDDEGFDICTKCGAVGRSGGLSNPHNRPYPKDIRHMDMSEWTNQCSGSVTRASFSHSFPSDLTVFRIPLREPMEFVPNADWFESAAQSLAEALVMGASRSLGIEDQELEGGFRTRSADLGPEDDARGFIEIFLFDTTSGGAGFSSKVWDEFDTVLEEARSILADCDCATACHSCLRRYQNRHLH
jgi:hypothetical protein